MGGTGPSVDAGPGDRAPRPLLLLVLVLLPAGVLAGCIAEPSTELTLRRGDLARLELVVANGTSVVFPQNASEGTPQALCGDALGPDLARCTQAEAAYVLRGDPPAALPEAWRGAKPLPDALIEALSGLQERDRFHASDVAVWGPYRDSLVDTHPVESAVTRFVPEATAYGRHWNTTEMENGSVRLDPGQGANGTLLEIPRWCNERFCLFRSALTGTNQTHLFIEHQATRGDRVDVESLDTTLRVLDVSNGTFTVDGNPPRAGERYDVFARVIDIRGPPEGSRRAPGFDLTTVDGQRVALSEMLGRPVVLEFFATWCPSCIRNTEHLNALEARFGQEIEILSIGVDPWEKPAAIRSFIRQNNVSWPVAIDETGRVSQAYRVGSLSTQVIVSPKGAIVHTETGVADHERVVGVLEGLLAGDHHGHDHAHANESTDAAGAP